MTPAAGEIEMLPYGNTSPGVHGASISVLAMYMKSVSVIENVKESQSTGASLIITDQCPPVFNDCAQINPKCSFDKLLSY
jgi:hypothetical protein